MLKGRAQHLVESVISVELNGVGKECTNVVDVGLQVVEKWIEEL